MRVKWQILVYMHRYSSSTPRLPRNIPALPAIFPLRSQVLTLFNKHILRDTKELSILLRCFGINKYRDSNHNPLLLAKAWKLISFSCQKQEQLYWKVLWTFLRQFAQQKWISSGLIILTNHNLTVEPVQVVEGQISISNWTMSFQICGESFYDKF